MPEDSSPRPTRIRVCTNTHAEEVLTAVTAVHYSYAVQVVSERLSTDDLVYTVPKMVSGATVDSVARFMCSSGTTALYSDNDPHRRQLLNSHCILSVSAGDHDYYMDDECGVATHSTSCSRYNGDIHVTHTDECSQREVAETVEDILAILYTDRDFCLALLNYEGRIDLGRVVFGEPIGGGDNNYGGATGGGTYEDREVDPVVTAITASESAEEGGLNAGGIAIISAMAALAALAALLLLFVARKRRSRSLDDDKSIHTNWSDPTADSFLKPDFHDLGLQHSTADVHRCASAFCEVCKPNLGKLDLVPVGKFDVTTSPEVGGDHYPTKVGSQEHLADAYGLTSTRLSNISDGSYGLEENNTMDENDLETPAEEDGDFAFVRTEQKLNDWQKTTPRRKFGGRTVDSDLKNSVVL